MSKFSPCGFIRRSFSEGGQAHLRPAGFGGQAAIEYAIVFVVFTLVAILLWTIFIESGQPGQPTPVVEEYVGRVKGEIE